MISARTGRCVSGSCCQLSGRACVIAVSRRLLMLGIVDLCFTFLKNSIAYEV